MSRSLNKATLIGNLTHDPELRYTPQGNAVCTFSMATNRQWATESGEKKDEAEFHRIVSWNKLAEICAQFLGKGRKVYIEGRLQTRDWETKDGAKRQTTEIVANEMIILDSRRDGGGSSGGGGGSNFDIDTAAIDEIDNQAKSDNKSGPKKSSKKKVSKKTSKSTDDDIPF